MDVLHLVVDCLTSSCVWCTLEKALASPSNSRIMQLHGSFQDLQQGDASVTTYMQHAKSLFDELVAVGRPLSLEDFNLYIFCGLHGEFKDLVTSLVTKAKHYQKIDKYKRKYRGNIFVGKFPRDFTDGNIPSVYTEGITVGKKVKQRKKNDDVSFLPTDLPTEQIPSVIPSVNLLVNCEHCSSC